MDDTPPERSLSMWLTQGLLLIAGIYSCVAVVLTLLSGTTNPGFALYVSLLLVLPVISLFAFLKQLPAVHRVSMLSLVCLWGWILRVLWIWAESAPASVWEMSTEFQAVLLLLTTLSFGIPVLVAKLEFERRSAATLAEDPQNQRDAYLIGSPIAFDNHFFDLKPEPSEFPKSFDN